MRGAGGAAGGERQTVLEEGDGKQRDTGEEKKEGGKNQGRRQETEEIRGEEGSAHI